MNGNINAMKKQDILEDHLWPVVAQHFPQGVTFFKMMMLQSTAQDRLSLTKPYTVTRLARSITRSQYHRNLMAFHKKGTSIKEKQHKFIGRIIFKKSENLDRHNIPVCAKFIHVYLYSK